MLVVNSESVEKFVNSITTTLIIPNGTRSSLSAKFAPANCIFLASRYAHYFGGFDLLESIISCFHSNVNRLIKGNKSDLSFQSFWMANCSQLIYFFKKDIGLVGSTAIWQVVCVLFLLIRN